MPSALSGLTGEPQASALQGLRPCAISTCASRAEATPVQQLGAPPMAGLLGHTDLLAHLRHRGAVGHLDLRLQSLRGWQSVLLICSGVYRLRAMALPLPCARVPESPTWHLGPSQGQGQWSPAAAMPRAIGGP